MAELIIMKRLDREEFEAMDEDRVRLIDEVLEVFCDHQKKGKEERLTDEKFRMNYLNLYREFGEEDFFSIDSRMYFFEEKLSELDVLKIEMIDAEEADYTDDSLQDDIFVFIAMCLIVWFIAGPLMISFGESDLHYGFLTWLQNLGDLHWFIYLWYLIINYGIFIFSAICLFGIFPAFFKIFKKKLSAEQQKDKAITLVNSKIENLCKEVKSKKYIKKFLNTV